jgi:hypothetical protein
MKKTCSKCALTLSADDFPKKGRICRPCHRAWQREWSKSPEQRKKSAERQRRRRQADPEFAQRQRRTVNLGRYGLTEGDLIAMWEAQGRACAVCKEAIVLQGWAFSVDHDHDCCPAKRSCGKCLRGLLCGGCNRGLGQFRDDSAVLREAAAYLEAWALRKVS